MWDGSRKAPIEHQDPQCVQFADPVQLFSAVAAEHAGTDDDDVERIGTGTLRRCDLLPVVANVATDDIVAKIGLLNVVASGI